MFVTGETKSVIAIDIMCQQSFCMPIVKVHVRQKCIASNFGVDNAMADGPSLALGVSALAMTVAPAHTPTRAQLRRERRAVMAVSRRRRNTELMLIVMAVIITGAAYTIASLGENAESPPGIVVFVAFLLGLLVCAHMVVRYVAAGADATASARSTAACATPVGPPLGFPRADACDMPFSLREAPQRVQLLHLLAVDGAHSRRSQATRPRPSICSAA